MARGTWLGAHRACSGNVIQLRKTPSCVPTEPDLRKSSPPSALEGRMGSALGCVLSFRKELAPVSSATLVVEEVGPRALL